MLSASRLAAHGTKSLVLVVGGGDHFSVLRACAVCASDWTSGGDGGESDEEGLMPRASHSGQRPVLSHCCLNLPFHNRQNVGVGVHSNSHTHTDAGEAVLKDLVRVSTQIRGDIRIRREYVYSDGGVLTVWDA
ncbi:hypothetical protein B0H17DRAFT_1148925 [Mycena rosella]|uniref:Uncharacterized protein n=1 Tax=Mycena rosella TaxID=1033263 RepID=A0AAD7FW21_MYCRO|nr:hypothetical protein B0H17DRAFT_1148925 [Mycena rosella]